MAEHHTDPLADNNSWPNPLDDIGVIRWEDPPEPTDPHQTRRPWALVAAQLRSRPGQWALIDDQGNATVAARIRTGGRWWRPQGAYEATIRNVGGRLHVYARYIGT